jgi:hypothetical protein
MDNYEKYYHDINIDKKKKAIEINIYVKNDKEIRITENIKMQLKQLIGSEILRFFYRHHDNFNPSLFYYFKNINTYANNINTIKKHREDISSGLGLIIINIKNLKKKYKYGKDTQTIPGFIYLYLSKESMPNPIKNFEITIKINKNEYYDELNKKKKAKKTKRKSNNYQKNKIKNWDNYTNGNSKSNNNLTKSQKKNKEQTQNSLSEPKLKSYDDEDIGFTVFDHDEDEKDDVDNNDDDKNNGDDSYLSEDD